MPVPELNQDDFATLIPRISNIGALKKGGQKVVLPCDYEGQRIVLKALELHVPFTSPYEDDATLEVDDVFSRVKRELLILERCESAHIVKLGPIPPFNIEHRGKHLFVFSEEFINGDDLAVELRVRAFDAAEIVKLGNHILSALETLDEIRTLHRDIKPPNIMRRVSTGDYLLLDMGIAFDFGLTSITSTGVLVGSVPYLSPERLDIRKKRDLDIRSEFFSLGVVLYEAATHMHPFAVGIHSSGQLVENILTLKVPHPSGINPGLPVKLGNVILRMLEKKPHLRFKNAALLRIALNESLN